MAFCDSSITLEIKLSNLQLLTVLKFNTGHKTPPTSAPPREPAGQVLGSPQSTARKED